MFTIEPKTYTEQEYLRVVKEYNDLIREHYKLKTCMLEILQENIRIIDELNKIGKETDDCK
jgi:IS30 family transposase